MTDNGALITHILNRMAPFLPDDDVREQLRSQLTLLDQFAGDEAGQHLGEMLGSVERAIAGLEAGSHDAAIAEADRWGIAHLVRAALESTPAITVTDPPAAVEPRPFGARSES